MNSIDHAPFRAAFRMALGEEGYRRFVAAGTAPRLRYWQEVVLKNFLALHPEHQIDATQLADALRICELHDGLLQLEVVEVIDGCLDYSQTYLNAKREKFPHAAANAVSTEGRMDMPTRVSVWYCTACRAARSAWINEH